MARGSLAGGGCRTARGVDALADVGLLCVPTCIDDLLKGVGRDGGRLEDDGLHLVAAGCREVRGTVARSRRDRRLDVDRDVSHRLASAELEGCLTGRLAE